MSKWVLIEAEDNTINEPDFYGSYDEAYKEMKIRFDRINDGCDNDSANISENYAFVSLESTRIDWRIFKVCSQAMNNTATKKVIDIVKELDTLNAYCKILWRLISGIESDFQKAEYMRKTFGVQNEDLRSIESYLSVKEKTLRDKLYNCDVNI